MLDKYVIHGGNKLYGSVTIQTSKNATLPIMAASIIAKDKFKIFNPPKISDVNNMLLILNKLGAIIEEKDNYIQIDNTSLNNLKIDCKLSKTMRSSIFLLGALLNRFKFAIISAPGGCKIGKRPIDLHINS